MMWWTVALMACSEAPPEASAPEPVEAPSAAAIDPRAARAAAVATAIQAGDDPAAAMKAQGLDEAAFRALMYEIAADHDLSVQYERARAE